MTDMILRSAGPSPFVRKVRMTAEVLGLTDRIALDMADVTDPKDTLLSQNPLGKVPALVLKDGTVVYDSCVIVEHLDQAAGGGIVIPEGAERIAELRLQALADGMMDAGILQIYERRYRPEDKHHEPWVELQAQKVARALTALEADPPARHTPPRIGEIAVAAILGYLDFRFDGTWRTDHPKLVAWLDQFAKDVPAFDMTAPE
ncbi:MAG: glutathione S-transferase family protein [Pseudomonadota bacterium]